MSDSVKLMQSFLNYCADKSKVINQNIANINSENYKRKDVDFSAYLQNEMTSKINSNETKHLNGSEKVDVKLEDAIYSDNKQVSIEEEMAELARNTINFKFAAKRVGGYYKNIQSVIRSGGQ